jgi:uncharacterized membrane protein (DUF106 family)
MAKEIIIDHKEISNNQNIMQVMEKKFKEKDLNLHVNEVKELSDDHRKGIRRLQVKNTKYFFIRPSSK